MSAVPEANRQHYNEHSENYDSKHEQVAQIVTKALHERKDWIEVRWAKEDDTKYGRETRLLDYACGTGSITKALGPLVTTIRGIDISENMVQKYNEAAQSAGIKPEQINAVLGDLLADEVPAHLNTKEYQEFDLAVIGLGFHHFDNPVRAVQRLSERLKSGTGVLLIIDFLPFDDEQDTETTDPWKGTVKTRGFARANIEKLYKLAGLEKFSFSLVDEPAILETKDGGTKKRSIFIARGVKEPTRWGKIANWVYDIQVKASDQFQIGPRESAPDQLGLFGERSKG